VTFVKKNAIEVEAKAVGLNYVGFGRNCSCMVNLCWTVISKLWDLIKYAGFEPVNFRRRWYS
jgi:succinyl-CoA synthetase beta subunit